MVVNYYHQLRRGGGRGGGWFSATLAQLITHHIRHLIDQIQVIVIMCQWALKSTNAIKTEMGFEGELRVRKFE